MTPWKVLAGAVGLGLALSACSGDGTDPGPQEPEGAPTSTAADRDGRSPDGDPFDGDREVVASGLEIPWALAHHPEGDIFVTERPGRVRLIRDGELVGDPVAEVDVVAEGEGGLLGIDLHPSFLDNAWAYLYFTSEEGGLHNRVVRFVVEESGDSYEFVEDRVIVEGIPAAGNHNGGRIAFGPDEHLYIGTGDAGDPNRSADPGNLGGKILRVDEDGRPGDDPPFDDGRVYAYGLRNPQGLAWDDRDRLYATEHGPSGEFGLCCLDELNLIERGGFYGWPYRSGGEETGAGSPPEEPVGPVASSGNDTWAPSGLAHVSSGDDAYLAVGLLAGSQIRRFTIDPENPHRVNEESAILDDLGRVRDVSVGPDGCAYILTSNRDGRGRPADQDDRVIRSCP